MDSRIVLAARAYAARIRKGDSPAKAEEYISTKFGRFSDTDLDRAIYEAQTGTEIGERLQSMKDAKSVTLSEACPGDYPCIGQASVRIRVDMVLANGRVIHRSIYREMDWSATIADVDDLVKDYVDNAPSEGYDVKDSSYVFEGPTFSTGP